MSLFKRKTDKKERKKMKEPIKPLTTAENSIKDEQLQNIESNAPEDFYEPLVEKEFSTIKVITPYKRLVNKKLTIILIENTTKVAKEKEILLKIVKNAIQLGLVSIINYGGDIRPIEIFDISDLDDTKLLFKDDIGDNACLYNALVQLNSFVFERYMKEKETEKEKVIINEIEIIGIGTCTDNCSMVKKQIGIDFFCEVASKPNVTTKYFCLTEENFMDAAEIGFHSIGSISRTY